MADQRELIQAVVEVDMSGTERRLLQLVVEADWEQSQQRWLTQIVIEVDGENWTFATGRVLSGQFV
jgi:hypothetical protein